jgi:putative nucleotidyltransferase with HDIG domain
MSEKSERIKNIALKVGNLPTLPTVIAKMLDLVDNPKTHTKNLANLISNDQSLTARILKTANSAYYGLSREISTVDTAIVVMGYNAVKEMGLSLSVIDAFKNIGSLNRFDVQKYWEHSVGVGTIARAIAKKYMPQDSGEMFVAGLLHDIGKMILIQYMPQDFYEVLDFIEEKNVPFWRGEQEILGVTHCEIGYLIAERWNLPEKIGNLIRFHHSPIDAPKKFSKHAAIIDVSDAICHYSNVGNKNHRIDKIPSPEIIEIFAPKNLFNDGEILKLQEELFSEIEQNELLHSILGTE